MSEIWPGYGRVSKQQKRGLHVPGDTSSQNQLAEPGRGYASGAAPEDIQPDNSLGIQPGLNLAPQKEIKGQPSGATTDSCLAAHIESKIQDATCARNTDSPRD